MLSHAESDYHDCFLFFEQSSLLHCIFVIKNSIFQFISHIAIQAIHFQRLLFWTGDESGFGFVFHFIITKLAPDLYHMVIQTVVQVNKKPWWQWLDPANMKI